MGYGPEDKNAVLELTYNYGVMDYDKGNGYAQVNAFHFPVLEHSSYSFCNTLQQAFVYHVIELEF